MDDIQTALTKTGFTGIARGLVVGVADYQYINPLPHQVLDDAKSIADVLIAAQHCGYASNNVTTLLNEKANLSSIRNALKTLADESELTDAVFIYFTGHGGHFDNPEHYSALLPVDFSLDNIATTCLSDDELSTALKQIRAKRILVILDACHSGGAANLKSVPVNKQTSNLRYSEKSMKLLSEGQGRVIMASSRETEVSYILPGDNNSVFTKHLLNAMQGQCVTTGDGVIRVFDLFNHVSMKVNSDVVHRCGEEQHPQFKAHNLEDNFAIALDAGGISKSNNATVAITRPSKQLESILSDLYPMGPIDQEIWARAGGDCSRLRLNGTGRANWFSALKLLIQGGGGASICLDGLVETALEDYPHHPTLNTLKGA